MIDLGTLGGSSSVAYGVNASGQIVGESSLAGNAAVHAVLWQPIANLGCKAALAGCNLKEANLAGAYLKNRDLSDANLKGANLARANLSGANLSGANLKETDLTEANLVGANLKNVNLKDANLTDANIALANLKGANVKDVVWSNTVCPDGTNSDANGGTCVNEDHHR